MDYIKEAFQRVKQDIDEIRTEINSLKDILSNLTLKLTSLTQENQHIVEESASTHQHINQTVSAYNPTHNYPFKPLKPHNLSISTGNEGVPTDKQTNRQTNQHITFEQENTINNAAEILSSLDSIKKDIRLKFKRLTEQEFLVFSTLYQIDEEQGNTDYKELSQRLSLSESSIRDYIGRIIKKGVPVEKDKINNKTIKLSISPNLKKIATLSTILQLRDI